MNIKFLEDEDEVIILPETYLGEFFLIIYALIDIAKSRNNRKQKIFELKRQIKFFVRYMEVK